MSALTKAALDEAISKMEEAAAPTTDDAVIMLPSWWIPVHPWVYEYMKADRRKRRRMSRLLGRKRLRESR